MYTETQLVRIAKRENNSKRTYLVVNKDQGKHIPVSPKKAFAMFDALAEELASAYKEETLLLIGFAETATAIGARIAICLHADYIQTTREQIEGVSYLYFSETHSHAAEQKLVREDVESVLEKTDRIVFVEDEVTTGNTILNIIHVLEETYPKKMHFAVASLLNGMDQTAQSRYADKQIPLHYLVKTSHTQYGEIAEHYLGNGIYRQPDTREAGDISMTCVSSYINARRCTTGDLYADACSQLWNQMKEQISWQGGERILVLGTEECMYPALFAGAHLEQCGNIVRCHATTRSPIAVSTEEQYPLHERYELISLYEEDRKIFLYDLEKYDRVWIVTDAKHLCKKGVYTLLNALKACGNEKIQLFRWC